MGTVCVQCQKQGHTHYHAKARESRATRIGPGQWVGGRHLLLLLLLLCRPAAKRTKCGARACSRHMFKNNQ